MDRLPTLALELRERRGPRVLVLHRREGDGHAHHPADSRPPHPGAADDRPGLDAPPRGLHSPDAPALNLDACHLDLAVELRAARTCLARHRLARAYRLGDAVRGHEEPAVDFVRIEQRDLLGALLRSEQSRLYPPRGREPLLALEVSPPFRGRRNLQTPHRVEAWLPIELQLRIAPNAVARQARHRLRRVGLEDETRRVGGGSTGLEGSPSCFGPGTGPAS